MGLIWILSKVILFILTEFPTIHRVLSDSEWFGWTGYVSGGLLVGILAWYQRIRFTAQKQVDRMKDKLKSAISSEDKKRFEELNTLHGSKDPAERERFLHVVTEYRQKITEALKNKS